MAPQAKNADQLKSEAEARTRQSENEEARMGADDDGIVERGATEPLNQNNGLDSDPLRGGVERREPIQRSPQDDVRSKIAARFRRTEDERPFNGDFSDQENIAGVVGQNDEDDDDDDLADMGLSAEEIARARGKGAPAADADDEDDIEQPRQRRQRPAAEDDGEQPRKHRLKVNGRIIELSDDEVLARASKVEAADSYLQEARDLLKQAKAIRSGQTVRHDGENGADTADLGNDPPDDEARSHEPTTRSVIEKIQFGDPDEAAADLDRLVDSRAGKKATEGQLQRVISQDLARSKKQLAEFTKSNPELAGNELAALAIENGMYRGYREDIIALGLDEEQIPRDSKTLAEWHRYYRVNGYDVRQTKDLLEEGKRSFLKQVGQFGGKPQQQRSSRQSQTRVNVNRDERRMNIPSQPTRSVAPRRDVQPSNRPQTGSDVVNAMRRQRGQPVA